MSRSRNRRRTGLDVVKVCVALGAPDGTTGDVIVDFVVHLELEGGEEDEGPLVVTVVATARNPAVKT